MRVCVCLWTNPIKIAGDKAKGHRLLLDMDPPQWMNIQYFIMRVFLKSVFFHNVFLPELDQPPVAHVASSPPVSLPARTATLDGSHSTDDKGGVSYLWTRDDSSPAAGVRLAVVNNALDWILQMIVVDSDSTLRPYNTFKHFWFTLQPTPDIHCIIKKANNFNTSLFFLSIGCTEQLWPPGSAVSGKPGGGQVQLHPDCNWQ